MCKGWTQNHSFGWALEPVRPLPAGTNWSWDSEDSLGLHSLQTSFFSLRLGNILKCILLLVVQGKLAFNFLESFSSLSVSRNHS